ncbi:MAG: glucose-6-phosphate dehydrogenase [Parachlamydiaceae bacterium]|nr:glucose-6-phosphate dehydrogenase [Parachlamydiaceae bacterium]
MNRQCKSPEPCVLVIFGATGDLTSRKLLPALYNLALDSQLPKNFVCVAFARKDKTDQEFRDEMLEAVSNFSRVKPIDKKLWKSFSSKIFYHRSDFHEDEGYENLRERLEGFDKKFKTKGNRLYYLSTQPSFFSLVTDKLKEHELIYNYSSSQEDKWSRVIVEKPFGHDLQSAEQLQHEMTSQLNENQIFRIDHYLGKETVQNILLFRFSNLFFEANWNNRYVDHIQISVSEDMGVGTRGKFWEEAGMLRDIVQNHMMQLLSLVAMEPPTCLNANAIRNEKVKVVESIRPFELDKIDKYAVRGQYGKGKIKEGQVKGYRQEDNVDPKSNVETFVALELFIDNWRWSGVPFYLRAGKRLPSRATEIAVVFKEIPGFLFETQGAKVEQNVLVIRIQPDEGISLRMNCKVPGLTALQPVKMDFQYGEYFKATPPEAYERLLYDCMIGDNTLFARADEVMASWRLLTPLLEKWNEEPPMKFPNYPAGTWGPKESDQLLERSGRQWL